MAIELQKESLNINQIIGEKNVNDIVETDCIVPDVKPDLVKIIETSGVVNVYKKEITEGKIRIDGTILAYIMYYGKSENKMEVRSINHSLDFSEIIQIDNITSEMIDDSRITLQNIECKIINERKISIKANVNYDVKIYSYKTEKYISNISLDDIQKKEKTVNVKTMLGSGETKTNVSEKISIDQTDEFAEILKVQTSFSDTETKISYNKVLTKSNLNLKFIFLTEDNKIKVMKKTFPIMGFVDMKDVKEECFSESKLEIKNMILKSEASKDHTINADFEIGIKVFVYENRNINLIEDMYSTKRNLSFTQKSIKTISSKESYSGTYSLSEKQNIGITNERVLDIEPSIQNKKVSKQDGEIVISGDIEFEILIANENYSSINRKSVTSSFSYKIPAKTATTSSEVSISYYFTNENYSVLPGGDVDFKMDVVFKTNVTNISNLKLLDKVTEESETLKKSNMVIYFTKDGDDMWKVAKKFHVTEESIKEINKISENTLKANTQLYIV